MISSSALSSHCRSSFPAAASGPRHVARTRRQLLDVSCMAEKKRFGSFDEMLAASSTPVLVDFYATWCGPCQMLAPALSSVSKKLEGRLQVIKIDTDKNPAIATRFNISALPTMVFFKPDGKIVDRIEGLLNEGQLMDRLEYLLKANQT